MLDELTKAPCPALPKPVHLTKVPKGFRQTGSGMSPSQFLPSQPSSEAEMASDLCQQEQLNTLACSKSWYMNRLFKLLRHPFKKLLTVNTLVRSPDMPTESSLCSC